MTAERDARRRLMADAYRAGSTLAAIGADHGITRERVRQLIKGLVTAEESKAVRLPVPSFDPVAEKARIERERTFRGRFGFRGAK